MSRHRRRPRQRSQDEADGGAVRQGGHAAGPLQRGEHGGLHPDRHQLGDHSGPGPRCAQGNRDQQKHQQRFQDFVSHHPAFKLTDDDKSFRQSFGNFARSRV